MVERTSRKVATCLQGMLEILNRSVVIIRIDLYTHLISATSRNSPNQALGLAMRHRSFVCSAPLLAVGNHHLLVSGILDMQSGTAEHRNFFTGIVYSFIGLVPPTGEI